MSKTKKSKLLASMLCASVVAGLYAGPVMAGNATYDANSSGITINIDTERTGDGDGIFIKNGLDWNSTYKATGKITISTANLVTALNGSSFETLTIGGQAINSTTIGDFKTDYSALKAKVDALDTTDLTGRVDALESKVGVQNGQVVLKNGGNVGVLVGTGTTAVAAGGSKIALNKADNTVVTSVNGMEVIKTNVDGTTFKTTKEDDGVTSINGGTITAGKDVVAGVTSLVTVGEKTTALENKTTAIEYTPGDPDGIGSQKLGTTTIKDKLNADIFSANQGTIGGVTMAGGAISTGAFAVDNSGNITAGTVNGVDVVNVGEKTTAIEYTPGDPDGIGSQKLGTTTIKDKLNADIFSANQGTIGGVTLAGGAINAGAFAVDNSGNITANNLVTNKYDVNATFDELTDKMGNVSTITVIEDTPKGTITDVASHLNVQGDITANGDVITRDGASLNGLHDQVEKDALNIHNLQVNTTDIKYADGVTEIGKGALVVNNEGYVTINNGMLTADAESGYVTMGKNIEFDTASGSVRAKNFYTDKYDLNSIGSQLDELETGVSETNKNVAGITRKGEVTTIEGATSFDANGMKVGNNVTINKDGSMEARNGDASMYFNDGNISLNNGTNSVMVGNNSITLDADGTTLTMNHDGLDYADGAFTVRNDGTVYANGSMTADDFITKDGIKLSEVNAKLDDLEGSVGETNKNTAGIKRDELTETTTIEGATSFDKTGMTIEGVTGTTSIVGGQATFMGQNGFTQIMGGNIQTDSINGVNFDDLVNRVEDLEDKTQNITGSEPGTGEGGSTVPPTTGGETGIEGDVTVGGDLTAGSGNIGGVTMEDGKVTAGEGNFSDKVTVGGENGTSIDKDGVNVGGENGTSITDKDVVINQGTDNEVKLSDVGNRVDNLEQGMASMSNRISKVEDRIDKVGAMSAAIANLRTMGYDPTAPTEIAVGIGQYRSETGAALGLFHYPNKDFMLSLSVSTSGDEVMGGIGATWKFGRKSPEQMLAAEKEKAAKAKLAKAEAMKKAAAEAKVAEQQAKHAKMAAEKAAK